MLTLNWYMYIWQTWFSWLDVIFRLKRGIAGDRGCFLREYAYMYKITCINKPTYIVLRFSDHTKHFCSSAQKGNKPQFNIYSLLILSPINNKMNHHSGHQFWQTLIMTASKGSAKDVIQTSRPQSAPFQPLE